MVNKSNRRRFLKTTGAMVSLTGATMPVSGSKGPQDDLFVQFDTLTENGVRYTACVCHSQQKQKTDGAILPTPANSEDSYQDRAQLDIEDPEIFRIRQGILEELRIGQIVSRAKRNQQQKKSIEGTVRSQQGHGGPKPTPDFNSRLWQHLFDAGGLDIEVDGNTVESAGSGDVQAASETVLERAVRNLSSGLRRQIKRVGAYYIRNPEGTSCSASVNSLSHRQLGASVEYSEQLGTLGTVAIGTVVGAVVGSLFAPGAGTVVGGLVGLIVSFALQIIRRSNVITVVYRDRDACVQSVCAPAIRPYVSGIFMDENRDLLRIDGASDSLGVHIGNGVRVGTGYREVIDYQ